MTELTTVVESRPPSPVRFTLQKVEADEFGYRKIAEYSGSNGASLKFDQAKPESGAISTVYLGTLTGGLTGLRNGHADGEQDVAVKLPLTREHHERLFRSTDGYDQRKKEAVEANTAEEKLLKQLRAKQEELFPGSKPHFPDAEVAIIDEDQGVIMEKAGSSLSMYLKGFPGTEWIKEDQLNQAMIQYFEALATAHAIGVSVNDKKEEDLRYDPQEDKLVVLDWNVVAPSEEVKSSDRPENRAHIDLSKGIEFYLTFCRGYGSFSKDKIQSISSDKIQKLEQIAGDVKNRVNQISALDIVNSLKALPLAA